MKQLFDNTVDAALNVTNRAVLDSQQVQKAHDIFSNHILNIIPAENATSYSLFSCRCGLKQKIFSADKACFFR